MLTHDRMLVALEVIDALRSVYRDSPEEDIVAGVQMNTLLALEDAMQVINDNMPDIDPYDIPNFLKRQAE